MTSRQATARNNGGIANPYNKSNEQEVTPTSSHSLEERSAQRSCSKLKLMSAVTSSASLTPPPLRCHRTWGSRRRSRKTHHSCQSHGHCLRPLLQTRTLPSSNESFGPHSFFTQTASGTDEPVYSLPCSSKSRRACQ